MFEQTLHLTQSIAQHTTSNAWLLQAMRYAETKGR